LFWKRSPKKLGEGSFGQVYIYPAKINRKWLWRSRKINKIYWNFNEWSKKFC
jgi:hypothetical protein